MSNNDGMWKASFVVRIGGKKELVGEAGSYSGGYDGDVNGRNFGSRRGRQISKRHHLGGEYTSSSEQDDPYHSMDPPKTPGKQAQPRKP